MKPHKWAKEIKAWADGAEIEWRYGELFPWEQSDPPGWHVGGGHEYRIKPKTRKAIIDGVEYVLPEALPVSSEQQSCFSVNQHPDVIWEHFIQVKTPGVFFATREDAELFAKAEKALRGIL